MVAWRPRDRLAVDSARGPGAGELVAQAMNAALAGILRGFGFRVQPPGYNSAHLVHPAR